MRLDSVQLECILIPFNLIESSLNVYLSDRLTPDSDCEPSGNPDLFQPDVLDTGRMGCMEERHLGASKGRQPCHTSQLDQTPQESGSPHGPSGQHDTDLPKTFHRDRNFYGTNEVYGLQFPCQVQASSWAQKHQLAGRDIMSLTLHELCWQGWNNFALRSLAQGRYASILFARSIKEATFMSFLMQKFRESKADLDQLADLYCDQQGIAVDSSVNESAQKSAKMKHFCEFIFNQCKPFQQQELCDAQERIRELEQQMVQAQKSAPASSSAQPPSKRTSAEDPTPDNKKRRLPIASQASPKPVKPAQTLLQKAFRSSF